MTRKKTADEPVEPVDETPPPEPIDPQTINPGSSFETQPEGSVAIYHPDLDVVSYVAPESLPGWRDSGWLLLNEDGSSEPIPDDPSPPPPPTEPAPVDDEMALPGPPEGFVTIVHPDLSEGSNTGYVHPDSLSVYGAAGWQLQTDDGVEDIDPEPEPDDEPATAGDEPVTPPVEEEQPPTPEDEEE